MLGFMYTRLHQLTYALVLATSACASFEAETFEVPVEPKPPWPRSVLSKINHISVYSFFIAVDQL